MSPTDEAMDSSNTQADEDDKPRRVLRNLSFSEGRERAQAAKVAAEQSKHTKKRNASRSPRREALETEVNPYKNLFASDCAPSRRSAGPGHRPEGDRLRRELAPVSAGASPDEVTALEATSVASCSAEPLPRGLELLVCCLVASDLACAFAPRDAPTWGMLRSMWRP
ncbi:hypothetical protein PC128_g21500 [Phytophthora cactorum]|nr:hypothetical protein PC128_g21500 [Phytophthora cactorum]